jgi:hypothetical protein
MKLSETTLFFIMREINDAKTKQEWKGPLDSDDVDYIIEQIKNYVNFHEDNITQEEYNDSVQ